MLPVDGRPFLSLLVERLRTQGVRNVVFSVGHHAEVVMQHFGDGSDLGIRIDYIVEAEPQGTGAFLLLGRDVLDDAFFVLNGDTFFDVSLRDLERRLVGETQAVVALMEAQQPGRYGGVDFEHGIIRRFGRSASEDATVMSGGVYAMRKVVAACVSAVPASIEADVFPALAQSGRLAGWLYPGPFLDIGLPDDLHSAASFVQRWWERPIAFLDRDGVVIEDLGHVGTVDRVRLVPGASEAIALLNEGGFRVVVVTNQAGIAKGYYTETDFWTVMDEVQFRLRDGGGLLDAVYFCPHHPTAGQGLLRRSCGCRKPASGMILAALESFPADRRACFLIGDQVSDVEAAANAGIRGFRYPGNGLPLDRFVRDVLGRMRDERGVRAGDAHPAV